jgi:cholesterol oxidase
MRAAGQADPGRGLPHLSDKLGYLTRTNSESLGGATTLKVPKGLDLTKGVAITSSFHVAHDTHVENVRYGPGSNAMGFLATIFLEGGHNRARRFVAHAVRHPIDFARATHVRRWSERSVIALVMQSRDNSLVVSEKRRRGGRSALTSRQGHGEPNPTWIPEGQHAIKAMARRLAAVTGEPTVPSGAVSEVLNVPLTAHFLGGCVISGSPDQGVVDKYQRVWRYPGLHVVDGSAVSANLGVNPSLTITAQAERAMSLWPRRGEPDERPTQADLGVGHPVGPSR